MAKRGLNDEEIELEILRLQDSEAVKLTRAEIRYKNLRRSYLYQLRWEHKHGLELMDQGYTQEDFRVRKNGEWEEEQCEE